MHRFLMGLDETVYGTVRSNLLTQDPLPSLNKVYSKLVQEECVRTVVCGKEEHGEIMSFVVQADSKFSGGKDKNIVCSNYNHPRHKSDSCFQLIDYLEWWGDRPKGTGQGAGHGRGVLHGIGG